MLKVALAQLEVIPGRPDLNVEAMLNMIDSAKDQSAELIVFPEMALPGYFLGDLWEQSAFLRDCECHGQRIIEAAKGIVVVFGNVAVDWNKKGNDGRTRKYNAVFVAQDAKVCGGDNYPYPFRVKTLQPNYREFDDSRHFFSAVQLAQELGEPIEDLLTPIQINLSNRELNLACILCEDGWDEDYSIKPTQILAQKAPLDLIINASASPFTLGKNNKRNRVFMQQAAALHTPIVYVNNVGVQNIGKTIYTFDGCSAVYDNRGNVIAQAEAFIASMEVIDLPLEPERDARGVQRTCEPKVDNGIETIFNALAYCGRRMLDSMGMEKVVIGASGGVDSAVSAALYCHILGPENVLLVNMPSRFNSATTRDLAAQLAINLECLYTIAPIQNAVDLTINQLSDCAITDLAKGESFSLTIAPLVAENIQARDRSARVLAAFAAALGGGFTCNANKSEITVGYSTLYGDLAGFMAIIGDLWKYQVYELGQYLNEHVFRREVIPQAVFDIVPSAELSSQQDVDAGQGDPIHYSYHDQLFRAFQEWWEPASPEDILRWYTEGVLEEKLDCESGLVNRLFPDAATFVSDLERWWSLFKGLGIAKRIQAPPIAAVSRRAYGFDYREAQNSVYYTSAYRRLKDQVLSIRF